MVTAPVIDLSSYASAVEQTRQQIIGYSEAMWATATLTDEMIDRLVEVFAPAVQAAQYAVANMTSVYLAAATGTSPVPVGDDIVSGRGVPIDEVYARPVVKARALVSQGKPVAKAFQAGGQRLESIATTDLQMAKVRQAQRSLQISDVEFYRRVPTGNETCAMCLIASTRRYRKRELMPLHPGCDCNIDVIPDGMDMDLVLDEDLLEVTHEKVKEFAGIRDASGKAVDYRKLLITHEHGELGPVVAWRGQNFTGPADL